MPNREEMFLMLEARVARLEAVTGITPDANTIIDKQINKKAVETQASVIEAQIAAQSIEVTQ